MDERFLVYENWRAVYRATVHMSECKHARNTHNKISDQWLRNNKAINGRWFGYFSSIKEAVAFATLLPNRKLKICDCCFDKIISEE